jgi:hypothetical protein
VRPCLWLAFERRLREAVLDHVARGGDAADYLRSDNPAILGMKKYVIDDPAAVLLQRQINDLVNGAGKGVSRGSDRNGSGSRGASSAGGSSGKKAVRDKKYCYNFNGAGCSRKGCEFIHECNAVGCQQREGHGAASGRCKIVKALKAAGASP